MSLACTQLVSASTGPMWPIHSQGLLLFCAILATSCVWGIRDLEGDAYSGTDTDGTSPRCGNGTIDEGEECDDGNDVDWDGCRSCEICEFQINTVDNGHQLRPAVSLSNDGRFVVVWQNQSASGSFIYARIYSNSGVPEGDQILINNTLAGNHENPAVAIGSDGEFLVAWTATDVSSSNVLYRIFSTPSTGDLIANSSASTALGGPAVVRNHNDTYTIVWWGVAETGSGYDIYARGIEEDGTLPAPQVMLNQDPLNDQTYPAIGTSPTGFLFAAWTSPGHDGNLLGVVGRRFNMYGASAEDEFVVNTYFLGDQQFPSVAMSTDGRAVVAWQSEGQDSAENGIYAQRYDDHGSPSVPEFRVNIDAAGDQTSPSVGMSSDGRFAVAWSTLVVHSEGPDVLLNRYDSSGTLQGTTICPHRFEEWAQQNASLSMSDDGKMVVVWESYDQDGSGYGIFAQRYDADGNPRGVLPW